MHTCGCLDPNFYMNHYRVALHHRLQTIMNPVKEKENQSGRLGVVSD